MRRWSVVLIVLGTLSWPAVGQRAEAEIDDEASQVRSAEETGQEDDLGPPDHVGEASEASITTLSTTWIDLGATSTSDGLRLFSNSSPVMYLTPEGNVGIGIAAPVYPFEVLANQGDGGARIRLQTSIPADITQHDIANMSYSFQDVAAGITNSGYAMGITSAGYLTGAGTLKNAYGIRSLAGTNSAATGIVQSAYAGYFRVINGGSAGGSSVGNGFGVYVENVEATNGWGIYQVGADDRNYFGGMIGLGTAPQTFLHIKDSNSYSSTDQTNLRNITVEGFGNDDGGGIVWRSRNGKDAARIVTEYSGAHNRQNLVFYTNNAGDYTSAAVPSMVIEKSGRVGIGTTTPAEALHVAGNAVFAGTVTGTNIQAQYQDLAEWVPSTSKLQAGMVVVLDLESSNRVTESGNAYDTAVAGVVSAQPGLLLGEAGEGKEMIATTGRVKVRVTTANGSIAVGDLLVTSDQPGTAMKSKPVDLGEVNMHRPGTIIGKALEPLETGDGEILVLLSLQ